MRKVLIVDDEVSIADGLKALFELDNIDAAGVYDRGSAEKLLASEYFPVVLADLRLHTEEEGLLLIDAIRRLSPQSRIATLTAYATPAVEAEVKRRGSSIVLRKPMTSEDILAIIGEMLDTIEREAAEGENAAAPLDLDALYQDVKRILHSIPQRKFGLTTEETDDLVQDAWLLFLQKRSSISANKPWLAGTVVNLCKQRIQKNSRNRDLMRGFVDEDEAIQAGSTGHVSSIILQQALDRLDERGRSLCTLIALEGWSYDEVSAELGLPIGSVGPLFMRAKAKLQTMLSVSN